MPSPLVQSEDFDSAGFDSEAPPPRYDAYDDPAARARLSGPVLAPVRQPPPAPADGPPAPKPAQTERPTQMVKAVAPILTVVSEAQENNTSSAAPPDPMEERDRRRREDNRRALADSRRKLAGLTRGLYAGMKFDSYQPKTPSQTFALSICQAFAESYPIPDCRGMALVGAVGVGKSHLMAATGHAILSRTNAKTITTEIVSLISIFDSLLLAMKGTMQPDGRTRSFADILEHYASLDLVLLDDFATERADLPGWTAEKFYWLVNEWTLRETHLILTTNKQPTEWVGRYDERIVDRLYAILGGRDDPAIITVKGPSGRNEGGGMAALRALRPE